MKRKTIFIFLILGMLFFVSCAAPATPTAVPVESTRTPPAVPTIKSTATQTPALVATQTATQAPVAIDSIPGFEDWALHNAPSVDVQTEDGNLVLALKRRALWYMDRQGVLAYKLVEGDFKITADVYTMKRSDPSQAPGGDGTVQLGGVMARNAAGAQENYVFIVAGSTANGLAVETKNTINDFSEYNGPEWDSPHASLRLCRVGQTFNLYKRHIGSDEAWIPAASFERPDLPESLQVGVNIYTDSAPDLQIRYENVTIEPITSSQQCEAD